jgi:hypothetical protein
MSLFSTPEPPQEDPEAARLREEEEQRAKRDRIKAVQEQLQLETQFSSNLGVSSLRRRGRTSLLGAG